MKPVPVDFEILPAEGAVRLEWSDGVSTRHSTTELRQRCPCAHCRTERQRLQKPDLSSLRILQGPASAPAAVGVVEVEPVGRYALRFVFDDGHSTGIYTYEFLREMAG